MTDHVGVSFQLLGCCGKMLVVRLDMNFFSVIIKKCNVYSHNNTVIIKDYGIIFNDHRKQRRQSQVGSVNIFI